MSMNNSIHHLLVTLLLMVSAGPASIVKPVLAAQGDITVESADPPSGEQDTVDLDVTIQGKNFKDGATAHFWVTGSESNRGGVTVHSTTFVNPRTLVSRISIAADATEGGFDIEVYSNGRRGKGIDLFSVVKKGLGNDTTPPDAVGSLQVDSFDHISVDLSWTASGDDGMVGIASQYLIRYLQDVPLTEANWDTAIEACACVDAIPVPSAPGSLETFILTAGTEWSGGGPLEPETDYSIGVRVVDNAGNISPLAVTDVTTAAAPASNWTVEMVDYGRDAKMALDSNGRPALVYNLDDRMVFSFWNGQFWEFEDVQEAATAIDVEFSPMGDASISYVSRNVTLATRNGSSWTLESGPRVFSSPSTALAFDGQNHPMVAYRSRSGSRSNLVLGHFNGSSWSSDTIDLANGARYMDMVLDSDGNPAIAYSDDLDDDGWIDSLKLAQFDGLSWTTEIVDTGVPQGTAGIFAGIAYSSTLGDLVLADLSSPSVDYWTIRYLQRDSQGQWFEELVAHEGNGYLYPSSPSLAVDSSGIPHLAFTDGFGSLYLASRTGDTSDPWVIEFVETSVSDSITLRIGVTQQGEKAYIAFPQEDSIWVASKLLSPAP